MITIVFSKNRAAQLELFLRSYQLHVTPIERVTVIYQASSEAHLHAYEDVFAMYTFVAPKTEYGGFRTAVLRALPKGGRVIFFVDDQVFIRNWDVLPEPGLSLRLAPHLTRNYASDDAPQPVPPLVPLPDGRLSWQWSEGTLSWAYPLSLDGHVFDLSVIRPWIEHCAFHSPNTLESALQAYAPRMMHERGSCYPEARVVNIPWNLTQTDWVNRHEYGMTPDDILAWWEAGYRISLMDIDGVRNESVHQVFPLTFEQRHADHL